MARICTALLIVSMVTLVGCNKNKTTDATDTAPPPADTKGAMTVAPPPDSGATATPPANNIDSGDPKIVMREPATPVSATASHSTSHSTASKSTASKSAASKSAKSGGTAAGGKTYTVQAGDSMWKIASKTLGSGSRWKDIAAANPGVDPNKIKVGQKLNLPA